MSEPPDRGADDRFVMGAHGRYILRNGKAHRKMMREREALLDRVERPDDPAPAEKDGDPSDEGLAAKIAHLLDTTDGDKDNLRAQLEKLTNHKATNSGKTAPPVRKKSGVKRKAPAKSSKPFVPPIPQGTGKPRSVTWKHMAREAGKKIAEAFVDAHEDDLAQAYTRYGPTKAFHDYVTTKYHEDSAMQDEGDEDDEDDDDPSSGREDEKESK